MPKFYSEDDVKQLVEALNIAECLLNQYRKKCAGFSNYEEDIAIEEWAQNAKEGV